LCRAANAEAERKRRHRDKGVRPDVPVEPLVELLTCLKAFGISERQLSRTMYGQNRTLRILEGKTAEAKTKEMLEHVHWALWRSHGPFRKHCKCELPTEILTYLEAI
jgi:hypothetical protein